jgi:hypothetical protein
VRRLTQADVKFFNRARLPEPGAPVASVSSGESGGMSYGGYKTISAVMEELDSAMIERFEALHAALMALGDDVRFNTPVSCSASSRSICSTAPIPAVREKRSNELSTSRQAISRLGKSGGHVAVLVFAIGLLSFADSSPRA